MLQLMRRRLEAEGEEGFTLIELMVVVLIIAILIAIAIPTFLGARTRAQDRQAQTSLRNALGVAKSEYIDQKTYALTAADLAPQEPSLTFQADSTGPKEIALNNPVASTSSVFYAAVRSGSGTCFYLRDDVTPGTATSGTMYAKDPAASPCTATDTPAGGYSANGW
jgi:type IV pilus assembly protein PilA